MDRRAFLGTALAGAAFTMVASRAAAAGSFEITRSDEEWRAMPAPTDVHVDDRNIFQPDLFVLPEGGVRPHLDWEIPLPIWVIEVLSPRTARYDEKKKLPAFAEAGAQEGWLIAPRAREIEVHDLRTGGVETVGPGGVAESLSLPGFRLPLDEFFV